MNELILRRGIMGMVAMVALLAASYAVAARTPGYQLTMLLAGATIIASVLSARTEAVKPFLVALGLGAVMLAVYVLATPTEFGVGKFRLGQIAMLALSIGVVMMMILVRRGITAIPALASAIGLASLLVLAEAMAGFQRPPLEPIVVRDEWSALLAARPLADMPSNRIPPAVAAAGVDTFGHGTASLLSGEAMAVPGPLWAGVVEPDSVLGVRIPPHTSLTTRYIDNPRSYFDLEDMRPAIWTLGLAEGSAATLVFPPESQATVRVAIARAQRDVPSWHININQAHLALEPGAYTLEFRARADRPRTAVVAVTQAGEPFDVLGLLETFEVIPEWKPFRYYFTPPRAERNARIHFALGGNEASVEIADVVLTTLSSELLVTPAIARAPYAVGYSFNAASCRDRDYPETPPNSARRLLLLGDGFTMGVGVHERDTFGARLESDLADHGAWEVVNCGMPGYGSREVRAALPALADRYHPGVVLVTLGLDDDQSEWEAQQRAAQPSRWETVSEIWGRIRSTVRGSRTRDFGAVVGHLKVIAKEIRDRGVRLVVVVPRTTANPAWDELAAAVTAGLSGEDVEIVDLGDNARAGRTGENLQVSPNDLHPNELVHRAVAERLATHLLAPLRPAAALAPAGGKP
ncbi:MAG: hypothetical protein H0W15_12340 [Gemmatimonadales bacterium]|nr:hypothetical protein [Gemmatimonadales bacterium]